MLRCVCVCVCAARADAVTTTTTIASITKQTMTMTSDVTKPKSFQGRVPKSPHLDRVVADAPSPCAIKNVLLIGALAQAHELSVDTGVADGNNFCVQTP